MCPLTSIGIAALTVERVAYGAKNYTNFKTTLNYSSKLSMIIALIMCIIIFIFAQQLSLLLHTLLTVKHFNLK
ncbi:MATE family efflux transporter [uncultured Methanobrevibacter sp.]|uniref:MATE family efflux transporter n=1 Tax=uncultured Methanobrevibacter sp. TaxID=253161 RepID=UPI003448C8DF